jgi:hypothetical protein
MANAAMRTNEFVERFMNDLLLGMSGRVGAAKCRDWNDRVQEVKQARAWDLTGEF